MRIVDLLRSSLLILVLFLSPMSLASPLIDLEIEKTLDEFIELPRSDPKAVIMLHDLWLRHNATPALKSWVRLANYVVTEESTLKENPELAESILFKMLQVAETTDNPDVLAEIYGSDLEVSIYKSKLNDAVIKADLLQFYVQRATEPRIRYYYNNVLGSLYAQDFQFRRALLRYKDALAEVTKTNNKATVRRRSVINFALAEIYAELKDWTKAKEHAQITLDDTLKLDFKPFVLEVLILQAGIAAKQKHFDDALQINKRGMEYAQVLGDEYSSLTFKINLGSSHVQLAQYTAAKEVFIQALQRAERLKDEFSTELLKFNLGFIDVMQGQYQAGFEQMQAAMKYFEENDSKLQLATNYEWLAKAYSVAGMHKEQADALLEQVDLLQEAQASEREAILNELHNRYDRKNAERAAEVARLEQEKALQQQLLENEKLKRQSTIIVVVIVGVAALLLLYFYRKVAAANQKLNSINTQLAYQSKRDPLTGIFNRRALQQFMQQRGLKRRRQDNQTSSSSLLLLDIDHFKQINDQYGHSAGDAVLIAISERLLATVREQDMVVRWGGEEILLVLENLAPEQHHAFVERVLKTIGEVPVAYDDYVIKVTASGGFIPLPFAGVDETQLGWEQLMQIIDLALYRSKANGRNQVCVVNALNVDYAEAKSLLFTDLSQAVDRGMVDISTINGPTMAVAQ